MSFPQQCTPLLPTLDDNTLHIFANASLQAYGAVIYMLQGTHSTILMSKSRAAPLKTHTLPRLELMAAVVASQLCSFVIKSLHTTFSICFWSDSQIVLSWIFSEKKLKPFVSNRVAEIQAVSTAWRYCPSADNPADLLTRGITADQLCNSDKWNHGPSWLPTPTHRPTWERCEVLHIQEAAAELDDNSDTVPTDDLPVGIHLIIKLNNFSSLTKLIAVTAYTHRFIVNVGQFSYHTLVDL